MSKTADVLEAGAETLREWADWAKTDCFETFEEWLLGIKLTDAEKPPIVTPPPKPEATYEPVPRGDTYKAAAPWDKVSRDNLVLALAQRLSPEGFHVWGVVDFPTGEFMWRLRCYACQEKLEVRAPYEAYFIPHVQDTISEWATHHGWKKCVRASIERDPAVVFDV